MSIVWTLTFLLFSHIIMKNRKDECVLGFLDVFSIILILIIVGIAIRLIFLIKLSKEESNTSIEAKQKINKKKIKKTNVSHSIVDEDVGDITSVKNKSNLGSFEKSITSFAKRQLNLLNSSSSFNTDAIVFYSNIIKEPPDNFSDLLQRADDKGFALHLRQSMLSDMKYIFSADDSSSLSEYKSIFTDTSISDDFVINAFRFAEDSDCKISQEALSRSLSEFLMNRGRLSRPGIKVLFYVVINFIYNNYNNCLFSQEEASALGFVFSHF